MKHLVEDPDRVIVGSLEELVEGFSIGGVYLSVVDKVFAGVFGVVRSRVFW